VARIVNTIGWIHNETGRLELGVEINRRGVELAVALGAPDPEIESNARLNLGDALLGLGRLDEAAEQFDHVERIVRHPAPEERWMLWRYAQRLFHGQGELCLARGDVEGALRYAAECLALAEQTNSKKNVAKARRLRGEAFLAVGDLTSAEPELEAGLEIARGIGNPAQQWKTLLVLAALRHEQGRETEASAARDEANALIGRAVESVTSLQLSAGSTDT
jgi:tetratricopeptide (TPR) repeat protein